MDNENELHIYERPKPLFIDFGDWLTKKVKSKKEVTIALSGGSTPGGLYDVLSSEFGDHIDWSKFHFYWGDERCVAPDNKDSNYKLAKGKLFDHLSVDDTHIHRIRGEADPTEEAKRYSKEIADTVPSSQGLPRFDFVILGLGDDGHTASIFPNQMQLLNSKAICETAIHPESGQKRITITGRVINNAENIVFLVTGEKKKNRLFEILEKQGDYEKYPAAHVKATNGGCYWFVDEHAAQLLSR